MSRLVFNVLFLCTGNSARSVLAEVLLNTIGAGRFRAHSAGSRPAGRVHPLALDLLTKNRLPTEGLRSKSWDEFAALGAPKMDFVFTVCGSAAGKACPVWPGQPMTAHWGIDDPAAVQGSEEAKRRAFFRAFSELQNRMLIFTSLPLQRLGRHLLQKRLEEIGLMGTIGEEDATSLADRIQAASRPLRAGWRRESMKDLLHPQS